MSKLNIYDRAIEVIRLTNDGEKLSPSDLSLVEMVVNNMANEKGVRLFLELYEKVVSDNYVQPWLQGIEHLTVDNEGYIYFKNNQVEHYDYPYDRSNYSDLLELQKRCLHVETLGVAPTTSLVIWRWDWLQEITSVHEWKDLFIQRFQLWESEEKQSILLTSGNEYIHYFNVNGEYKKHAYSEFFASELGDVDMSVGEYHLMKAADYCIPKLGQTEFSGVTGAPVNNVIECLKKYKVPTNLKL